VITYNYGYSGKVTTDTYTIETPTFSLLTPTRDGFAFNGWYLEETFENQVLKITQGSCGDKVYYASWEANNNTLIFNGNNNTSGTMSELEICTNTNINLPSNNFIKQGYTFKGWSTTADGEIEYLDCASYSMGTNSIYMLYAIWEANVDTKYTVEYYLQNIDNSYSLFKNEELLGTTDEKVDAPQEELEHFTFNAKHDDNVVSGIIAGDGTLVLKVYYQRNTYALSFIDSISNMTTNVGNFKYGEKILLEPINYLGYDFVGWYSGDKVLCEDLMYNVMIVEDLIVELKFVKKQEMEKYDFSSTETSCKIIKLTDTNLKEAVVPDYVTCIGHDAFSGCSILSEITIGKNVTSIENYAFYSCKALSKINYTGTIDEWCTINFSDQWSNPSYYTKNLYINNELVENIVIEKATIVSAYAFFNNSALISVEMANNVSSIGKGAFRYCSSLTKIVLSDAITFVGDFAFDGCDNVLYNEKEGLKYIGSDDNQYLYLFGVVSKDIIIAHIDENCKFIGSWSFIRCESLESVNIPKELISIGDSAFYYCVSLKSVLIGKSVKNIGSDAFGSCISITIYCESQEKLNEWSDRWAPITNPARPIYWYRETLPTTSGNYWHYDENDNIVVWG